MEVWIVLLRGVNVGGHRKLPMAEFRVALADLGFQDAATYIQSGNAVFRAKGTALQIAKQIGNKIQATFGFEVDVMVLPRRDMQRAVSENPFPQAEAVPTALHLFFGVTGGDGPDLKALKNAATSGEEFRMAGGVFYFYTPNGMGRSDLGGKLGRFFKTPITGRNLRSCHRIIALADTI